MRLRLPGVLLVQRDVGLLALRPQGQTALLQLRLGVIPVLVENELLQHTDQNKTQSNHYFRKLLPKDSETGEIKISCSCKLSPLRRSCFYFILAMTLSPTFPPPLTYLLSP